MRQQLNQRDTSFHWAIEFYDGNDDATLEKPLARSVHSLIPLLSAASEGPVAYNENFYVRPEHRKKKLGTALYAAERALYLRWGVREIHIDARDDGLVVWIKFGFLPQEPEALQEKYGEWARRVTARLRAEGSATSPPKLDPPEDPRAYPEAFLREQQGVMLYKVVP